MKRFKQALLASAVALSFGTANAAPVGPLFGGTTVISDNSAELFIDRDGNGKVTVGDIFVTIVGFNSIEAGGASTAIGKGTGFSELTSINAIKIKTDTVLVVPGVFSPNPQGITLHAYEAEALTVADAPWVNFATGTILDIAVAGPLDGVGLFSFTTGLGATNNGLDFALMYEDAVNNYTRNGSIQAGLTTASDGPARLLVQLDPANGDFLTVIAPFDIAQLVLIGEGVQVANSSISLDGTIVANTFGFALLPNITGGNGGFARPIATSAYGIWDNLDLTVTVVPEPGSMALLGLGLLGLGASLRKRNA